MKELKVATGETIAYRHSPGEGRPFVLLHGNFSSSSHWHRFVQVLPDNLDVYAPDLPGSGKSSYRKPEWNLKHFSDSVVALVREIGLRDVLLWGWSAGCPIAIEAERKLSEATELVLMGPPNLSGYSLFSLARLLWLTSIKGARPSDLRLQRNTIAMNFGLFFLDIQHLAQDIDVPTLVIRGDRDIVVSRVAAQEIARETKGPSEMYEVQDCGHVPRGNNVDKICMRVMDFAL